MRSGGYAAVGVLCALLCLPPTASGGGERVNARGMGMARTFVATSRGLDAVGINPANLALPEKGTVTVTVLPLGFHVGSEFLDYGIYRDYFTGVEEDGERRARFLSDADKERILSAFGLGTADGVITFCGRLFGVAVRWKDVGTIAITVTDELDASARIPVEYVRFALYGNDPGSLYDFGGFRTGASWLREYSLSFGGTLPKVGFAEWLAGGISVKLIHGYAYYEVQRFDASLQTSAIGELTSTVNFLSRSAGGNPFYNRILRGFPVPAGSGFGIDLGVSVGATRALSFGVSVTDVGEVKWKRELKETRVDTALFVDDPLQRGQRDAIERLMDERERDGNPFITSLVARFRFGMEFAVHRLSGGFPGELTLGLDYNQRLRRSPGIDKVARVSLGLEYKPVAWLPLRTGISFGGTDAVNIGLGFGVEVPYFEFEVGSENMTWLFVPGSFSYGSVAVATRFRF